MEYCNYIVNAKRSSIEKLSGTFRRLKNVRKYKMEKAIKKILHQVALIFYKAFVRAKVDSLSNLTLQSYTSLKACFDGNLRKILGSVRSNSWKICYHMSAELLSRYRFELPKKFTINSN